jgi:ribosomal-protein-alanine N-acetyltransferase
MAAGNSFFGFARGFEIRDSESIMEIIKCSLSEYYTKSLILDLYRVWPQAFIIYDNFDSVAGFVIGAKYSGTEGRILLFAVKKQFRGSGVGKMLLAQELNVMTGAGLSTVRLEVRTDNESAIRFYKKNGFSIISTLKNYYSDLSNAYLMWKII